MSILLKILSGAALALGSYLIGKAVLEMDYRRRFPPGSIDPHLGRIDPRRAARVGIRADMDEHLLERGNVR